MTAVVACLTYAILYMNLDSLVWLEAAMVGGLFWGAIAILQNFSRRPTGDGAQLLKRFKETHPPDAGKTVDQKLYRIALYGDQWLERHDKDLLHILRQSHHELGNSNWHASLYYGFEVLGGILDLAIPDVD